MFTRTTGLFIVPIWVTAMGWLMSHDVVPMWTAQEPPRVRPTEWLREQGRHAQFTVYQDGRRIGRIWTRYAVGDDAVQAWDLIWIDRLDEAVTPIRATVEETFTPDGLLDEITVGIETYSVRFRLHGERFHSDFAFSFESGAIERTFKVPLTDGQMIGGALHPFGQMDNLHVGQTWRMQVLNPLADLTGVGDRFVSLLVEVTGAESIITPHGRRHCFIVESRASKAWVNGHGEVLVQEITLPVVGTIRIVREADFDEKALSLRRRFVFDASTTEN